MPRTKKTVSEEAVVKAVEEVAAAPAEEAAPAPAKEEKPAKTRKPRTAKKAADKAPAEKKTAAKKSADKLSAKVVVELGDKSATPDELVERAKTDWANKGNAVADIKELAVYVNAAEGTVYYVVNDDYLSGSFDF